MILEFKHTVNSYEAIGLRILNSGPYFGTANSEWNQDYTKEEIFIIVDDWAARGKQSFNVKGTSYNYLKYLIERAHSYGLTVTSQLEYGVDSKEAIELGIDRVEHFIGGEMLPGDSHYYVEIANLDVENDSESINNSMDIFIEHGVYLNTIMGTYGA